MTPKGADRMLVVAAMREQAHRLMDAARELEAAADVQEELTVLLARNPQTGLGRKA